MSKDQLLSPPRARRAGQTLPLALAGLALAALAALLPAPELQLAALAAGTALLLLLLALRLHGLLEARRAAEGQRALQALVEEDRDPCFATDAGGTITYQNRAARRRFGERDGGALARALAALFASPSTVLYRLQERAAAHGHAAEQVALRRGTMRLSVHRIPQGRFLWRIDDLPAPEAELPDLPVPMLRLGPDDAVLAQNPALRRLAGRRILQLSDLLPAGPLRPGAFQEVTSAEGPATARNLVFDEAEEGRRLCLVLPGPPPAADQEGAYFDGLPVSLVDLDRDGRVTRANRMARELLEMGEETGQPLASLVEGLGRPVDEWLTETASGRLPPRSEVVRASRPGNDLYVQITLGQMDRAADGHLVAVLHDATELKTLEAQFVQSQKMQAIGQLAGGVAHDFNNLLTAISGHCDLLLLRHDERDPDFPDLEQINQNANRAASLVGQLLAFSRKQTLQPELLDMRDTMADLTHLLNRLVGEPVTLSFVHDPELALVRADRRQLEQVIMNLVVNARDAMPEGGTIRIETRCETLAAPLSRDRVEVPPGNYVVVRVADSGKGIAPEKLPKIFEPFFTTKKLGEGTGLGLSTAYGIVKQTGGYIFADSAPGQGATFSLYFPAHDRPAHPARAEHREGGGDSLRAGEGVVLLVEDEAPVRAFAARALRMRGYTVIEAENAEAALALLEDDSLRVDVFVTDVVMPGLDGPTWVRSALERRPGVRVVFVSGYAEESVARDQALIPNSVFLPKPFSLAQLTKTVAEQFA